LVESWELSVRNQDPIPVLELVKPVMPLRLADVVSEDDEELEFEDEELESVELAVEPEVETLEELLVVVVPEPLHLARLALPLALT